VWDTVGALGAPGLLGQLFNKTKYEYHDIGLNPQIANAVQALAIDERRKPFLPNIWQRPLGWTGLLMQAWFAGVHSDIGGGYTPDGLANEALHWVVEQAERLGLEADSSYLAHFRPCFNSVLHDSMTTPYKVMKPCTRKIGMHWADGEAIHQSVVDRNALAECDYNPTELTTHLADTNKSVIVDTGRIPRGKPCPPLP
jgi:hypothetical protein